MREPVRWISREVGEKRIKSHSLVCVLIYATFFKDWVPSSRFGRIPNLSSCRYAHYCTCSYITYILLPLSETSFSFFIFHRFLGFFQPRDSPGSPYCSFFSRSFLLLPHIVFRLISLCLYLSFCLFLFLSFSLLPSSGLNILRTFEAAAKGIKVPTALRAFLP